MALHLVLNPSAGHRHAQPFYASTLAPLLATLGLQPTLWPTQADQDGLRVGRAIRAAVDRHGLGPAVVLVLGGDGSAYELINGFFAPPPPPPPSPASDTRPLQPPPLAPPAPALELVPVPLGTANALFSHLSHARARRTQQHATTGGEGGGGGGVGGLQESGPPPWWASAVPEGTTDADRARLEAVGWWLDAHAPPGGGGGDDGEGRRPGQGRRPTTRVRLPLTRTTFHPPPTPSSSTPAADAAAAAAAVPPPTLSHIVLSLALHASLLHLSEALRPTDPGIGRFKRAADAVLHVRHEGALVFPAGANRWDPREKRWARPAPAKAAGATVDGPFAYVLATTTVDRLEPAFLIAPLLADRSDDDNDGGGGGGGGGPGEGEGRPNAEQQQPTMDVLVLRPDRSLAVRAGGRPAWEACVREVLGGAYQGGKHVDLVLGDPAAGEADDGGSGTLEYYRAPAFDFFPAPPPPATPVAAAAGAADDPRLNHLVCADGAVFCAPEGGHVEVRVLGPGEAGGEVWVWA